MTLAEIIIGILMAVGVGLLFYYGFKVSGPWRSFWAFMSILVLAGIIAVAWLAPFGPQIYGVSWLGVLFFILFFALILAAVTPPRKEFEGREPTREELRSERVGLIALGTFFWILIIAMAVAAIVGIFYTPVV